MDATDCKKYSVARNPAHWNMPNGDGPDYEKLAKASKFPNLFQHFYHKTAIFKLNLYH